MCSYAGGEYFGEGERERAQAQLETHELVLGERLARLQRPLEAELLRLLRHVQRQLPQLLAPAPARITLTL